MKTTLSLIKADTGSIGGHNRPSEAMGEKAKERITAAIKSGLLSDGRVTVTGDDIALLMIHTRGVDNSDIHKLAWDTFIATTAIAKSQGFYGPAMAPMDEMEYTGVVENLKRLEAKFVVRQ